jgi:uncharacterized phage-like protein YoqJ
LSTLLPYTLAVTGHRPGKLGGNKPEVNSSLVTLAKEALLYTPNVDMVITGMALGWDLAVAEACVELRVQFIAAVPFPNQTEKWTPESVLRYERLLGKAREIVVVSSEYHVRAYQERNEWIVDRAQLVLALWNGSSGGTSHCVRYAERKKVPVVNVWNSWRQL